jgi:hypothetical protein
LWRSIAASRVTSASGSAAPAKATVSPGRRGHPDGVGEHAQPLVGDHHGVQAVEAEEPFEAGGGHRVGGQLAGPAALDGHRRGEGVAGLDEGAQPHRRADEALGEEGAQGQPRTVDGGADGVGGVVPGVVVQVDHRLRVGRPHLGQDRLRHPAVLAIAVMGGAEAAVEIAAPRQHAAAEARLRPGRLDGPHEEQHVDGGDHRAQGVVDGAHAGGLVAVQGAGHHPHPPAVPPGQAEQGGAGQPIEERVHVAGQGGRVGVDDGQGHSCTGRPLSTAVR